MLKLTTTVYKYKRYAPWIMAAIAAITICLFVFSSVLHPIVNFIGIVAIFFIAIYAAVRPKSIFSVRTVDERQLVFTPQELQWGSWLIPIHELEKLEVYIHAYDTFRYLTGHHKGIKSFTTEFGDRNTVTFVYRKVRYDLTFYLGTFEHYDTLVQIMQCWRDNGIIFSARSLYTDSYIRDQVSRYG